MTEHLRREIAEVEDDPTDISEWVDVVILASDGAMRHGASPQDVIRAVHEKWAVNRSRRWPDWRGRGEDETIEHVRDDEDEA